MMPDRIASFDALRFLMITVIAVWHFPLVNPFEKGYLPVEFFFILSGFLSMRKFDTGWRTDISMYIFGRYKKFYPKYIVGFGLVLALHARELDFGQPLDMAAKLMPEAFLVQNVGLFHGTGYYYPMWYLSVLIWGGAMAAYLAATRAWALMAAVPLFFYTYIVGTAGDLQAWDTVGVFYLPLWRGVAGICLGMLLYKLQRKWQASKSHSLLCDVVAVACLALFLKTVFNGGNDILATVAVGIAIVVFNNPLSVFNKLCDNKVCRAVGNINFEMYVLHAFWVSLLTLVYNKLGAAVMGITALGACYVCLLVLSSFAMKKVMGRPKRIK